MRHFRRRTTKLKFQMTVWDIGGCAVLSERTSHHRNLPASLSAGRTAAPEVGQPKRPRDQLGKRNGREEEVLRENDTLLRRATLCCLPTRQSSLAIPSASQPVFPTPFAMLPYDARLIRRLPCACVDRDSNLCLGSNSTRNTKEKARFLLHRKKIKTEPARFVGGELLPRGCSYAK